MASAEVDEMIRKLQPIMLRLHGFLGDEDNEKILWWITEHAQDYRKSLEEILSSVPQEELRELKKEITEATQRVLEEHSTLCPPHIAKFMEILRSKDESIFIPKIAHG